MAFDTLSHAPILGWQTLQILHRTVTFLASHFLVDVPLVIEKDMFGHIIDLFPGCRAFGFEVLVFLFYPGVPGNDIIMAMQTLFNRRYAREIRVCHVGVAVLTLDLFDAAVHVMAERNGLFRAHGIRRDAIENK
jgi:hypothetical protein